MNSYGVKIAVRHSILDGEIVASPSKSQTHRALICASLANGISIIYNPLVCDDTAATMRACETLGARFIVKSEEKIVVQGIGDNPHEIGKEIDCSESGSTLRFVTPIAAVLNSEITFTGRASLGKRPIGELLSVLEKLGARIQFLGKRDGIPFKIVGTSEVTVTNIAIRGDVSSQFISGLLFALPLVSGDTEIEISTELESKDYVELTLDVLERFGIKVQKSADFRSLRIRGGQRYTNADISIEGDYSSSAYMLVGAAISGGERGVTVKDLYRESKQGDRMIVDILKDMGANVEVKDSSVTVKKSDLIGTKIDGRNIPDLIPILAIAATRAKGTSIFEGIGRLRLKESDRLSAIKELGKKLGCEVIVENETMTISGNCDLELNDAVEFADHRLVMAAVVSGLARKGEFIVGNPTAVKKSYPGFFDHLRELGADLMALSNTLGNNLRLSVYGESHGRRIGALLDGVPEGLLIDNGMVQEELEKRKSVSPLTTGRREPDVVEILSGVKNNRTTGDRIRLELKNSDVNSEFYERNRNLIRPGHADFTARQKYASVFDYRGGGFLSGRMTACFVAAGAIAKRILDEKGIRVLSHIVQIGRVRINSFPSDEYLLNVKFPGVVKCADPVVASEMQRAIEEAREERDSLGGIVECRVLGIPVGIGEPIFHSLEGEISQAMFSIPAVKGVEFGSGFKGSETRGSENNDPFLVEGGRVVTLTNNAGGILGGISSGMPLVFRVAIKPTSSISKEQRTIDYRRSENVTLSVKGRHDPCIAVRAPPVVEAMAALTVVDLLMAGGLIDGTD